MHKVKLLHVDFLIPVVDTTKSVKTVVSVPPGSLDKIALNMSPC